MVPRSWVRRTSAIFMVVHPHSEVGLVVSRYRNGGPAPQRAQCVASLSARSGGAGLQLRRGQRWLFVVITRSNAVQSCTNVAPDGTEPRSSAWLTRRERPADWVCATRIKDAD